jgi:hypothetical protein
MILYDKWHNFVIWPTHPDRVSTAAERLDTSCLGADSREHARNGSAKLVTQTIVVDKDDAFEQMAVGEFGDITIWTRDKVWCVRRAHGMEKLMYLPRHPPRG